jgi:biopolymer transport protein ExbB
MDLFNTIVAGGWVMIPLMAFSIVAIGVAVDRFIAFHRHRQIDNRSLRAKVLEMLDEGRVEDAAMLCANTPGPVSAVLLVGLKSYHKHKPLTDRSDELTDVMEKAMDDYQLHAVSAVQKRLNVLSTIGNAAPLLGMTGTVLGMIASFGALTEMNDDAVMSGISEALITTAAGLIIALIAVIPYNYFASAADRIELDIEEATTEMLDHVATRVEARQPKRTTPPPVPDEPAAMQTTGLPGVGPAT